MSLVTVKKYHETSGYSVSAIEHKIANGTWLQGVEYVKAPDGRILIDTEQVDRWARGERKQHHGA